MAGGEGGFGEGGGGQDRWGRREGGWEVVPLVVPRGGGA